MATYNGLEWIAEQIESIQNQVGVKISLYCSDDQSTDGTKEFIKKLKSNKIEVVLLPEKVRFGSAGANFLRLLQDVDVSKFDYVAFSDQDDIWVDSKLSNAINAIKLNAVDGYSGNVTAFWSKGMKKIIYKSQAQQKYDYMFESAGPGCSFVFTQKLAIELQRFLSSNQEKCKAVALHDWFTYAYARSHMYKWFIDREPYVLYRQHEENVLGANAGLKAKISRWGKMRQGWHRNQALLFGNLFGYEDMFPITALKRYHLWDRLTLIVNIRKFRRSFRDALALALFFMVTPKK
jgi:rhamnosyltransferase